MKFTFLSDKSAFINCPSYDLNKKGGCMHLCYPTLHRSFESLLFKNKHAIFAAKHTHYELWPPHQNGFGHRAVLRTIMFACHGQQMSVYLVFIQNRLRNFKISVFSFIARLRCYFRISRS